MDYLFQLGEVDGMQLAAELVEAGVPGDVWINEDRKLAVRVPDDADAAVVAAVVEAHVPMVVHVPLDASGVAATLNAVLGVWTLTDAANAVRLPEQALIDEALAWAQVAG